MGLHRGPAAQGAAPAQLSPLELFAAYYLSYTHYFDAWTRQEIDFETAAEQLAWLRDRFLEQARRPVCYRITRWKRTTVDRMLDGPAGCRRSHQAAGARRSSWRRQSGGPVVAWASRDNAALEAACAGRRIELQSGSRTASSAPPGSAHPSCRRSSLVFDSRGIFYDSRATERSRGDAGGGGVSARR